MNISYLKEWNKDIIQDPERHCIDCEHKDKFAHCGKYNKYLLTCRVYTQCRIFWDNLKCQECVEED